MAEFSSDTRMRAVLLFALVYTCQLTSARQFHIRNNLGYTIDVGILGNADKPTPENGGFQLDSQQERDVDVPDDWAGRVWARTGCNFDGGSGRCETGDCGPSVECNGAGGVPPATLAEFTLKGDNNQDFYDVSLVDGFNVPVTITPENQQGQDRHCTTADCPADLNPGCPADLQVKSGDNIVGCKSSCVVTGSDQDCCKGEYNNADICKSSASAEYFKGNCPHSYSYAYNDNTSIYTCDNGDYRFLITFG